jgi:tripartite-type tricarboxylate transporter receptor subunit TctC
MTLLRTLIACIAAALFPTCVPAASTADYPNHPITLVVPFAPGGFVHLVALMLSDNMASILGQPVVVINRPGANGNLAADTVSRADPDGYTIMLPTASILTINPHLYKNITFDPLKDFVAIGEIANTSNLFVVSPSSGIKTFKDLLDRARAKPDSLSYGSTGSGSIQHIAGEALKRQANVSLIHVPYKGVGPALTDVVGNTITVVFSDATSIPYVKAGRLVALAVSPKRLADLPDVPSLSEVVGPAGVPGYSAPTLWYGLVAPKGTPPEIVARLNAALTQSLKRPDVRDKLLAYGALPAEDTSSNYFAGVIRADFARYATMLKTLNINVD